MSVLDAEYDKAAHHELKQILRELSVLGPSVFHYRFSWVCWCGAHSESNYKNRLNARRGHRKHRESLT